MAGFHVRRATPAGLIAVLALGIPGSAGAMDDFFRAGSDDQRWRCQATAVVKLAGNGWFAGELVIGVKKNCAEAVRLYKAAAKAGYSFAMSNLGLLYYNGKCVARDYAEAKRLYEQALAASSENDGAMNSMGVLYYNGSGVPRNTKLGRQWFEKAAALGNPEAKLNLK